MKRTSLRAERVRVFYERLRALGFASYRDYLSSPHWQNVRRRYWASKLAKNKCCAGCGAGGALSLHHRTYKRIGEERLMDLVLVCRDCHSDIHDFEDRAGAHPWRATNKTLRKKRKALGLRGRDLI
nr:HNH endonuclease [Brevundimonas diminuta]